MTDPHIDKVKAAAKGHWLEILQTLAPSLAPAIHRVGKHVPCPIHGGKDGFRLFKDARQTGGGICNTCHAYPDGLALLEWVNHWSFRQSLQAVEDCLGLSPLQPPTTAMALRYEPMAQPVVETKAVIHFQAGLRDVWKSCVVGTHEMAEPLRRYFAHRRLSFEKMEKLYSALRFHPSLPYYDDNHRKITRFPGLVCAIRHLDGQWMTLHRTYLTVAGQKAPVASPRKTMPIPSGLRVKGGAIPLGQPTTGILGVAEGLETALSVFQVTGIPTWSTVNATLMRSVEIPENVHTVLIWADKDHSRTGQRAAYALKDRLKHQGIQAFVCLPRSPIPSTCRSLDWNDVLQQKRLSEFWLPQAVQDAIHRQCLPSEV